LARIDEDRRQATHLVSETEIQATAEHLAHEFPEVQAVWLFGSYARGEQRQTSDIDLAVMTSHELCRDYRHRADLIRAAEDFLGVPVDVVPLGSHLSPVIVFEALASPKLLFARNKASADLFASRLRCGARDDWPRVERRWAKAQKWRESVINA
jgi:predicted nucleotidyltransferase